MVYIVVSTDRGLCGGLNINLFKLPSMMKNGSERCVQLRPGMIGNKASNFFERHGAKVKAHMSPDWG